MVSNNTLSRKFNLTICVRKLDDNKESRAGIAAGTCNKNNIIMSYELHFCSEAFIVK